MQFDPYLLSNHKEHTKEIHGMQVGKLEISFEERLRDNSSKSSDVNFCYDFSKLNGSTFAKHYFKIDLCKSVHTYCNVKKMKKIRHIAMYLCGFDLL